MTIEPLVPGTGSIGPGPVSPPGWDARLEYQRSVRDNADLWELALADVVALVMASLPGNVVVARQLVDVIERLTLARRNAKGGA